MKSLAVGISLLATGALLWASPATSLEQSQEVAAAPAATRNDFNGDGWPDILLRHESDGRLYVWYSKTWYPRLGWGSATASGEPVAGAPADTDWRVVGSADFNHDGHADLLWHHRSSKRVYVWFMRRAVAVAGVALGAGGADWEIVGTPDMNADGWPDILWYNRSTGTGFLYVWFVNAGQVTGGARLSSVQTDTGWMVVGTPDLNVDGSDDIVWQHALTGSEYVWRMHGTSVVGGEQVHNPTTLTPVANPAGWQPNPVNGLTNPAWRIVGIESLPYRPPPPYWPEGLVLLNSPNFVWLNSTTGEVFRFYRPPGLWVDGTSVGILTDLDWKIVVP